MEGRAVSDIILDTGCTKSIVRSDLVSIEAVTKANQAVRNNSMLTWRHCLVPTSNHSSGGEFSTCAAVSDTLPVSL